jgi:hypothetical protein
MNTSINKDKLLNTSFTSSAQQNYENKICNALECYKLANTEITLKIGEKSFTILVCEKCRLKFE